MLSYKEQLLHPNWQRKRLEVLSAANWSCTTCGATGQTLHVHHKRYVKGRDVWDYESSDLEALCHSCHKEAHDSKDFLSEVIAQYPSVMWDRLAVLLIGYGGDYVDPALWLQVPTELADVARAGEIAWFLGNLPDGSGLMVKDACRNLGPDGFLDAITQAHDELQNALARFEATGRKAPGSEI